MLPVFAVTLGLVYLLARRIGLARWTATVAMVLFGLSPLSVTLNRQIYLDSFAVAWILGESSTRVEVPDLGLRPPSVRD